MQYWDVNNLYGCAMSQKLLVDDFKWIENTSPFNKDFIENDNVFLKLIFDISRRIAWAPCQFTIFTRKNKNQKWKNL